jgi:hypothetical protein
MALLVSHTRASLPQSRCTHVSCAGSRLLCRSCTGIAACGSRLRKHYFVRGVVR